MGWKEHDINDPKLRKRIAEAVEQSKPLKAAFDTLGKVDVVGQVVRIRQDPKPLMNKLEQDWFNILCAQYPNYPRPRAQAKRYKIANGSWYKPDVTATSWPAPEGPSLETAWECKGPKEMKNVARGILTIKTAAHQWPEVRFVLVWREAGQWKQQEVLP